MKVPARDSIRMVGRWALGSLYFCEHYDSPDLVPDDAVKTWQDNGAIMCLRPQTEPLTSISPGWSNPGRSRANTSSCIWTIGVDTMVKINSWTEGVQLEGRIIQFINKFHPEIPTTELIYEWIDVAWDRSFMIMKRAPGVELLQAWSFMTSSQRQDVANQVASHVKTLAQSTSKRVETVDKLGVGAIGYAVGPMPLKLVPTRPSWKPWMHPPFSRDDYLEHISYQYGCTSASIPDTGSEFVLYNPDIHARNVFVKLPKPGEKGELTQIIDWEFTGYWPHWWVATCPVVSSPFYLRFEREPRPIWADLLHAALVKLGFRDEKTWVRQHMSAYDRLCDERAGPEYFKYLEDCRNGRL